MSIYFAVPSPCVLQVDGLTALRLSALPRGEVSCIALSQCSGLVAAAGGGGQPQVVVLDAGDGEELGHLHGHTAPITVVKFAPDGQHIVSCSQVSDGHATLSRPQPRAR